MVFDRKRLEIQVLRPLSKGETASYQVFVWETDTLSEPLSVPDVDYVIIEGITSYFPDIEHYYNFKIWVDTTLAIAKARGIARDKGNENEASWDLWSENDQRYQQMYHPEQRANYIIAN